MTVSTTLKLPEPLKEQVTRLAEKAGKSPHAWALYRYDGRHDTVVVHAIRHQREAGYA